MQAAINLAAEDGARGYDGYGDNMVEDYNNYYDGVDTDEFIDRLTAEDALYLGEDE